MTPNLIDASDGRSQRLDERSLERLDFWTKALKDEGVYLWIDLHVGRRFLSGDDIPGFSELERAQEGEGKGFTFLNPRIGELMDAFSRAYLTHRNRYSGTTLATDPAVAAVLLTNENDLVEHFGNLFLGDKHNDAHRALFESEAQSFAAQNHLDRDRLEETWKPGPAKLLLASLEKRFFDARTRALRDLGYAGLVSFGSTWGGNSEIGLLSLSGGDVVDVHSYGGVDELRRDPRVEDDSLAWIGAAQVAGKPLTITEWNVPLADDRFTAPLRMAATASLQGWDAPMLYGWLQHPPGDTHGLSAWSAWSDPAIASLMPAAAVLFREAHVPESTDAVVFRPSQANLVDTTLSPRTSATLRTFYESRKLSIALPAIASLPWLAGTARNAGSNAATIVTDPQADGTATPARGPIRRDAERGVLVVDTPRSAVVSGFIGGQRLALQDVTAQIDTAAATVALTSLDGLPLATSQRILVSFVARVVGEGPDHDRPPLHAEPVRGTVLLTTASHLSLVLLDVHGARRPARQLLRRGAQLVVPLPADGASHWALLVP